MWDYIVELGQRMNEAAFSGIQALQDWQSVRNERRREFLEMVGLDPLPERADLRPRVHATTKGDRYTISRISFESLPGVHVAANLYVPNNLEAPAPAVLYVCGHGLIGTAHYQAHGDLWARKGYVCLLIDTLEQGDSRGDHHGIYSEKHFDWYDRGYAASGGELWNSMRALDYLSSVAEADKDRIGVTGISGGGALSWWVGIADERVKAIAPVCGTSTIASYLAERLLNGHCDCMIYHNLYQREMSEVGALCAPRPLLVGAASEDSLFSPPAYQRVVEDIRGIYTLYGKPELCQLCEYPGPHSYSEKVVSEIQKWFDLHVAGWDKPVEPLHEPKFSEKELTVFNGAPPSDDRIGLLPVLLPTQGRFEHSESIDEWQQVRSEKLGLLRQRVFRHFPARPEPLGVEDIGDWEYGGGTKLLIRDFTTEDGIRLRARIVLPESAADVILLGIMRATDRAERFQGELSGVAAGHALCALEPRGTGPTSWHPAQDWQMTRGSALVGRTVASMQLWDLLRAVEMILDMDELPFGRIFTYGVGEAGVIAIYAALLDERVAGALADAPPASHADGPHFLNILRVMDVPEAAGLLAPRPLGLVNAPLRAFHWTQRLYDSLEISEKLVTGGSARDVFTKLVEL
jgi:cephalosporin-C deacetylase-like acetyl esterase